MSLTLSTHRRYRTAADPNASISPPFAPPCVTPSAGSTAVRRPWPPTDLATARPDDPPPDVLTPRETLIVLALCAGEPRAEIAARIHRSRDVVDKTISEIYAATGFSRTYQVVAWAFRMRLASDGADGCVDVHR